MWDARTQAAESVRAAWQAQRASMVAAGAEREAERLKSACESVLQACATGMPLRHLSACAVVSDAGTVDLTGRVVQQRQGRFPYYRRGFDRAFIDDYTFEGRRLLVGGTGVVATRDGALVVVEARGRFSVSRLYHVVEPDEEDFAYVREALRGIDAARLARGTNAVRSVALADLRSAVLPWPEPEVRARFVDATARCDACGARELKRLLVAAWMLEAHAIDRLEDALVRSIPVAEGGLGCGGDRDARAWDDGMVALAEGLLDAMTDASATPLDVVAATSDLSRHPCGQRRAVCVCFPPSCVGRRDAWSDAPLDESDPRWVLGVPPRTRASYAWVQQTIAAMDETGCALLLLDNAPLHASAGRDAAARRAWAESGLVEAVVALPGGVFPDGRPPASFVLMRKGRSVGAPTLFIDAQTCGRTTAFSQRGAERRLPYAVVERIVEAYASWKAGANAAVAGTAEGFSCHAASTAEIATHDGLLTAWTYVSS